MADRFDAETRSRIMAAIRGKDTGPEMGLRRALHRAGHRFRLHAADLPGRPDVVFRSRRITVFVHGCFWHRHGACGHAALPKSNREFWRRKFARNIARDGTACERLKAMGWKAIIVWECELRRPEAVMDRLSAILDNPISGA